VHNSNKFYGDIKPKACLIYKLAHIRLRIFFKTKTIVKLLLNKASKDICRYIEENNSFPREWLD
jgi:hypothetical protein